MYPEMAEIRKQNSAKHCILLLTLDFIFIFRRDQELCESQGGRPGLQFLIVRTVSEDM